MPSMYVYGPKLDDQTRDSLVEKIYAATVPVFKGEKGPVIHTYVNEYEYLYDNGKRVDSPMVVVNMEAAPLPVEKIEIMGQGIHTAVTEVCGAQKESTFVYHANGLDHIAINGKLLKK